jgi:hypothetical protein
MERLRRVGAVGEKICGIQILVAMKLERRAVNLVTAGFDDRVHHRSGGTSELGRVAVGLNLEFLQSVDRGLQGLDV